MNMHVAETVRRKPIMTSNSRESQNGRDELLSMAECPISIIVAPREIIAIIIMARARSMLNFNLIVAVNEST